MARTWTCDPKCVELAEHMLSDNPELKADESFVMSLALEIQQTIEDSILLRRSELREEQKQPIVDGK